MRNQNLLRKIKAKYGDRPLKLCWASRGSNDVFLESEGSPVLFAFYRLDKLDTVVSDMGTLNELADEHGEEPYQIYLNGRLIYWAPDLRDLYYEMKNIIRRKLNKSDN
jgi:hypothetical protein